MTLCCILLLVSCNNRVSYPVVEISQGLKDVVNNGAYYTYGDFHHGIAEVSTQSGYFGFIDMNGKEVVPCKYTLLYYEDGFYKFSTGRNIRYGSDRKWGVLDSLGREIIPEEYTDMDVFLAQRTIRMKMSDNSYIFYNLEGNNCYPFDENDDNIIIGTRGFIDKIVNYKSDKVVYRAIGSWSPGATLDSRNEHVGLVDSVGTEIIPQRFRAFSNYSDGLVVTWSGRFVGVWDIINRKEILPTEYTLIATNNDYFNEPILFEDKYFIAENNNGQRGVFDRTGKQIIPCKYSSLKFVNGLIYATRGGEQGVLDYEGNEVLPFRYDEVKISKNCIQAAKRQDDSYRWGIFSRTGKEMHPCTIKYMEEECEGLIAASKEGDLWGYYDTDGDLVIPEKFKSAGDFSGGLAAVWYDGERGYINRKGQSTFDK
ncbi:WG containing repeat-containing protein [Xylanibacter ruminicola]|uniref:WG containing repeat-containing protein n=2 Tax=Xylanibacter ruminicola TaxID=839 RepID=A0A1M6VV10_XYLRU|nr:WG containing repeat-containing protein [Xylanibacter ruminicola]